MEEHVTEFVVLLPKHRAVNSRVALALSGPGLIPTTRSGMAECGF